MEIDHGRLERQATVEARLLARRLRGLPSTEVELLTQKFVTAFLREMLTSGEIDTATVLTVISHAMDLAIGHGRRQADAAEES